MDSLIKEIQETIKQIKCEIIELEDKILFKRN